MFDNAFLDQWLEQKTNEILSRVQEQKMSSEDILVLTLKAQVNHFHHMDVEFREEFKRIDSRFKEMDEKFESRFKETDAKFEARLNEAQSMNEKRFQDIDKRFDHLTKVLMWGFGILITSHFAMILKTL